MFVVGQIIPLSPFTFSLVGSKVHHSIKSFFKKILSKFSIIIQSKNHKMDFLSQSQLPQFLQTQTQFSYGKFLSFIKSDIPNLLELSANALKKAKFPTSLENAKSWSLDQWVTHCSVMAAVVVILIIKKKMFLGAVSTHTF